jgi:hypothetical protein
VFFKRVAGYGDPGFAAEVVAERLSRGPFVLSCPCEDDEGVFFQDVELSFPNSS